MSEFISVDYNELKTYLGTYTAVVLFQKKDGTKRAMLCTRNPYTIKSLTGVKLSGELAGHDKRHTASTGTLSVIDLSICEARAITVSKILGIVWVGILTDTNCEPAFEYYNQVTEQVYAEESAKREKNRVELSNKLASLQKTLQTGSLSEEEKQKFQKEVNRWAEHG